MKTINLSCLKLSLLLTSMIFNQEPLRYGTVMKLVLVPMEGGTSSSVLTSSFRVNKCGGCKLKSEHHSGARYFSLPKPI